jgi:uncharacterized protein (TIGR02757 family)
VSKYPHESHGELSKFLNQLTQSYHKVDFLSSDPLEFVHRYKDAWDQETVALLAAVLAYGNVKQIRKSVEEALRRMALISDSPRHFVEKLKSSVFRKKAHQAFGGYVHRFNCGTDLVHLFELLGRSWAQHGSLGAHFLTFLEPGAADISDALSSLIAEWYEWLDPNAPPTFSYLLTSPANGSCCKRWCMFLRWMGRRDDVDVGLWTAESPLQKTFPQGRSLLSTQLIMPLDTHTGRISQYLGLTIRRSLNWKAAQEVTEALRKVDPTDPTRYDFALSRLGILDICQRAYREEICKKCQLLTVCQFAQKYSNGPSRSTRSSA